MKTAFFTCVLIVFYFPSLGQKNNYTISENSIDTKNVKLNLYNESIESFHSEDVKAYLINKNPYLYTNETDINFESKVESPLAWHFTYFQEYNGIPIYSSKIKINISKTGRILSVFDNSFLFHSTHAALFPATSKLDSILTSKNTIEYKVNKVYFPTAHGFTPALKLQLADDNGNVTESIIDKNGKTLYTKDLNMYYHNRGADSIITAGVFLPNPLISSGKTYGAPYEDANNSDVPELIAEISHVDLSVKFENNTFLLESPWAKITEHSAPVTTPATSTIPEFIYTRSQNEFEDVNAFYHINEYQKYLQSLGFINLVNYQIHIDAHALNGSDQSNFSSFFTTPRLNFGEGGVDDAEDAHVIIHEYGHAIMHSAAPNTNSGGERQALDEAIGDYLAVSYSKAINPFDWHKVFSWDGHNSFWSGRNAASLKLYPIDLTSSYHLNGEIWSSTLMQLNIAIGRELTDQILLQSAYSYSSNMKMTDAAFLFLQADTLLTQGANANLICQYLGERGLYNCNSTDIKKKTINSYDIKLLNSDGFAKGLSDAVITFPFQLEACMEIFDSNGRQISSKYIINESSITLSFSEFNHGIYYIKFKSNHPMPVFKLVRF
ncbi:MAG: hypothetical protein M3Q58_13245 [Bacteroidota bacterium]|nr:hypothetical protein [Bacteroidota bacterium]